MMHIRKLLISGSALAAAAAFALVPVAQASTPGGNVGSVRVGVNTTGSYPVTLALKLGTSVTMNVFGSPTKLTCIAGGGVGTVHAGSPAPDPAFNFSALAISCDPFYGNPLSISLPANGCANWRWAAGALVHDGLTDTGPKGSKFQEVLGSFTLPGCSLTLNSGNCTVTVGGATTSNFDEDKDPGVGVTQNLNLKGAGLTIRTAGFLCLGAVSVGSSITMNSVNFNVASANGAIDFRDN